MLATLNDELGIKILRGSARDAHLLLLQRFVRLLAYGQSTLVLTGYLSVLGFSDFQMGLFMTFTLVGDVAGSSLLTLYADRVGRRKVLLAGSALMAFSGLVFASTGNYALLLLAAIVGVISPSGNEIGPFKAVEESTLAQITPSDHRSTIFAWYTVYGGLVSAIGSLTGGWITQSLQQGRGWTAVEAYRFIFWLYTVAALIKCVLASRLSEACEVESRPPPGEEESLLREPVAKDTVSQSKMLDLTRETQQKVWLLSGLFGVDSLASGLVPLSFTIYLFSEKFGLDEGVLGNTFFITAFVAAISNLFAASLARRIGNIKTMAFTHLPSSVCLSLIPLPSSFQAARFFLVARSCTGQMDVAPRTAFLSAYIPGNERTAVMGILNVVKTIAQSGGPTVTGWLASHRRIWLSFLMAGCFKASYDLAILWCFLHIAHF